MVGWHLEDINVPRTGGGVFHARMWREWCFLRVVFRHFRLRLGIMMVILLTGGILFKTLEPQKGHTYPEAVYFTWSLIFGEPPEAYPRHSIVLQVMFFLVPVLGLTVIIEGIVDFALTLRDRQRFERSWCMAMASTLSNHIVLVGFGRLGFRTFLLLRKLGEQVVVIERDATSEFLDEIRRDGSPLLLGDARREAILDDANIAKARSIILATNDDLANLEIALDARRACPKIRVVLRMFDQNMADKIRDGFNIHIAMSQASISAPSFAMSAIKPSIVNTIVVNGELVVMQRWFVRESGPLCGKTVGDVLVDFGFSVVEQRPQGGAARLFPPPSVRLEAGNELFVQGPYGALQELERKAMKLT